MRKTIIICDRCGRQFIAVPGKPREWRTLISGGVLEHSCLGCLEPEEIEEFAEFEAEVLRDELNAGAPFTD